MKRHLRPLLFLAVLAGAFALGDNLRRSSGIGFSPESLRAGVLSLGSAAPLVFLVIVVFRNFLALPSVLLLTSAGLLFGVGTGTLIGSAGILISGLLKCGSVRLLGRDWLRRSIPSHLEARIAGLESRLATAGPVVVALNTAHPIGILAPLHWAYGLTSLPLPPFAIALALTAPIRAYLCSTFGASLTDPGSPAFWRATALFLACTLVPLAVPALRRRLLPSRAAAPVCQGAGSGAAQ